MSEWFGTLPKEWEAFKINSLFSERREKVSDTDFAPLSVSKGGVVPQIATVAKSNAGDNRKLVRIGDFAINSRSDRKGSSGISAYDGSVSLINIVLTPRDETNGRYWHYLLKCYNFIEEYYRNGRGIVADLWTTRYDEMKSIYLPLPPRAEQDQIVRYLDWKVSGINRLINAKKKQIALLEELKRAVINEAVTRGGDGWQRMLLKRVCNFKTGTTPSGNEGINANGDGFNWFTPSDFGSSLYLDVAQKFINAEIARRNGISLYPAGSILFIGIGGTTGKVAHCNNPSFSNQQITAIIPHGISSRFLLYYLVAKSQQIKDTANYTTLPIVNNAQLSVVEVLVPPIEEQNKIVKYLEWRCSQLNKAVSKIENEITLLHEYRIRIIFDVVTGKKDVRGVVVPEYETVEKSASDACTNEEETEQEEE